MFDNPRKELERLQQELLAAEEPEEPEEPEADFDIPLEWDEEEREPLSHSNTDAGDDTRIWETPEEEPFEEVPEKPQKKHYVGLKFAIALELLGIAALFWWWYLWIR